MLLTEQAKPFDAHDWVFELKHDDFRALAVLDREGCRLFSGRGHHFAQFARLEHSLARTLPGRRAIVDGVIACLGPDGRSLFNPLLKRTEEPCFYTFDLLMLDGEDFCSLPLLERKRRLKHLVGKSADKCDLVCRARRRLGRRPFSKSLSAGSRRDRR